MRPESNLVLVPLGEGTPCPTCTHRARKRGRTCTGVAEAKGWDTGGPAHPGEPLLASPTRVLPDPHTRR